MFHILKELYWFRSKSEPRMDRHRYWLAAYLLLSVQLGGALLVSQDRLLWDMTSSYYPEAFFWIHYFTPHFSMDLALIVLHIIVGINAFGRVAGSLAGIGTYSLGALSSMSNWAASNSMDEGLGYPLLSIVLLAIIGVVALFMGFTLRSLRDVEPSHALLRQRPDMPAEKQLNCLAFLRRYLFVHLIIGVVGVAISGIMVWRLNNLSVMDYYGAADSTLQTGGFFLLLLAVVGVIWILALIAKRLNSFTDATAVIFCWGIALTVVIGGGTVWLAVNGFYDNKWLFLLAKTVGLSLLPISVGAQIYLLTKPSKQLSSAEAAMVEPSGQATATSPQIAT
ncbi:MULTISPECIES: hypothetical protein [Halomonadaceae]|jgi:hypothetical protein|uniref:Uncharacterized protein n=1 Tax=Halomonas campaniensis TaxID=213554 RepID=A0A246RX33_9GAMM|nr:MULTISPECIES: hypothetical protein [Halomonas]MBS3666328.1 hypothetical protein [Halomonas boliviensis]OWV28722.1 hypothetical protein JI62_13695 [Halomonas campaniensis]